MHVVITKVDEVFFDGEANALTVPGSAGEMTILSKHMPLISTLTKGTITVRGVNQVKEDNKTFPVESGILEVSHNTATVIL